MTAGEGINRVAAGAKRVTDRVADPVEDKVSDVTGPVEGVAHQTSDKIRGAASRSGEPEQK